MGFKLRIHADEIESIGGVDVAAELESTSAEHLMVITDEGIQKLAAAKKVIGNLLPATTFSLMEDTYAPARKMLDAGMAITLTTDSNPGSCPTANLQFAMHLGCFMMRLTPVEILNAVTINAAYSVDRAKTIGSFDVGKQADITIFDAPNLDYLFYFFATNLVTDVYKKGQKSHLTDSISFGTLLVCKNQRKSFKLYHSREWNHFSGKLKFDVQKNIFSYFLMYKKGKFLIE